MNKTFYLPLVILLIAFITSCNNEKSNTYTVNIQINEHPDTWIIAQIRQDGAWVKLDSAELKNGQVTFTGSVEMPEFYYFTIKNSRNYIPVFVESGEIAVTTTAANMRELTVEGSASHAIYQNLQNELKEFDLKGSELGQQYREAQSQGDEERKEEIAQEYEWLEEDKAMVILNFAKTNNTSVVSPFVINANSYMFDLTELEGVASVLDPSIASSVYTKALNNRIDILKKVEIGQPFIDFALNDPEGNPVPLSSVVNGKYVLVDFWASWCGPCRAENPNIVEAYQNYSDKGFDVFGVSFDRDYNKWVEAIGKDKLTWSHVSDLKYWESEAGKLYGVQSIPHSILLDPDGIIIAKNLRGADLQSKLAELLN